MTKKILNIITIVFVTCLSTLLCLVLIVDHSDKKKVKDYAIGYAESNYEKTKEKLTNNNLVKIGLDLLNKHNDISEDLLKVDSTIQVTIEDLKTTNPLILAELQDLDRKELDQHTRINGIDDLKNPATIKKYIGARYLQTLEDLPKEIIRFLLSNILVFLFIFFVSRYKKIPDNYTLVPSILLMISVFISMYFYIFNTDWFFKIIYGSYSGYSYLLVVIFVFVLINIIYFNSKKGAIL